MGKYDHLERDALVRLLERREAVHPDCGHVFMGGRRRAESQFLMLHKHADKLDGDGPFALERLRW